MRLEIENLAKIKDAKINIDGITVIAGENNTGKSTIGKTLFSIFNAMNNMDEKIAQEKKQQIQNQVRALAKNTMNDKNPSDRRLTEYFLYVSNYAGTADTLIQCENEEQIITELSKVCAGEENAELVREYAAKIHAIQQISDAKIMLELSTRWFRRVFEHQITPLGSGELESVIRLFIKDRELNFHFKNHNCVNWNSQISLMHQAFYIDNPFILDNMSDNGSGAVKMSDAHLLKHLKGEPEDVFDGLLESVMAKEKLEEIYEILDQIVDGDIIKNANGEYSLRNRQYGETLNIKNLSTGLKSFALLKRLLENGSLKEKDVLILDEPEIHLHPEWQLTYAELIVLLQKKFDLTVVITTHSPYFLDAIDVFSAKHKISDKVNFYLAENEENTSVIRDVTDNIDVIYKKLSDPMQKLENLRNGLM